MKVLLKPCLFIGLFLVLGHAVSAQTTRQISRLINNSAILNEHFTGFMLYDADEGRVIYEYNADKYFTPASNTKIYTLYASLIMLGDSIPALHYVERGDSLIFWGTGDPTFLNRKFENSRTYDFLKATGKQLYYSAANYRGPAYGSGWAWNDYGSYYQAEITAMPIYGNLINFYANTHGGLVVEPFYFASYLKSDEAGTRSGFGIRRQYDQNIFTYNVLPVPVNYNRQIPWKTSPELFAALLADTLRRQVNLVHEPLVDDAKVIYSHHVDTVLKAMMLPSDNFIAEQLLLVCASQWIGEMDTDSVRRYMVEECLFDLPQRPQWRDGSGLSRYNLFSPAAMVGLLLKIKEIVPDEERLHSLFPAGGISGTLRNAYKTDNGEAFIWAKTGSLSNNHNQSGYIVTRKGKKLVYSFMNNNFVRPTDDIRNEMVRIMTEIREKY